jgi:ERCC4-type nuclease
LSIEAVVIDQREPEWAHGLTFGGVPVMLMQLDAGDYWLTCSDGNIVAVERKTASDFLNSLRDERLLPQLIRLREVSPWAYLALVGTILPGTDGSAIVDGRQTGWKYASVAGALLTIQEIGISVLHVSNDTDLEAALVRLANRDRGELHIAPARDSAIIGEAESIVSALPGIGIDRAHTLVEVTGSAAASLYALTRYSDETPVWGEIPGISTGIKRRVRRALGIPDGFALCVIDQRSDAEREAANETENEKELIA